MRADAYDALYGSGNMPVDVSAIATAVLASSGFTAGGTMNVATLLKSLAALAEGTWNLKAGTTNTWQVSDADDKDVVVLEIQLKTNANPYRDVSRI
jgi:hypothetical protein